MLCLIWFSLIATSAVDLDTDRGIQEIIRGPAFADVTMLVIAYVLVNKIIAEWY
jgi:ABC-type multidrug transport system fused ATPase/permease subunit